MAKPLALRHCQLRACRKEFQPTRKGQRFCQDQHRTQYNNDLVAKKLLAMRRALKRAGLAVGLLAVLSAPIYGG